MIEAINKPVHFQMASAVQVSSLFSHIFALSLAQHLHSAIPHTPCMSSPCLNGNSHGKTTNIQHMLQILFNPPFLLRSYSSLVRKSEQSKELLMHNLTCQTEFLLPEHQHVIRSHRLTTHDGLHQKTSFVSIRPHSSAHSGDSSTQRPTLPSWPSIRLFTW